MPSVISGDANVSATEFGYLDGVTSALQTQIDGKLAAGAGRVLQVVSAGTSTSADSSSSTFADTNLTATITPSATSSKILVIVHQNGIFKSNGNANNGCGLRLLRGASVIVTFGSYIGFTGTTIEHYSSTGSIAYLDSPATTSATTYKTQFASSGNTSFVRVQQNSAESTITLLEISA